MNEKKSPVKIAFYGKGGIGKSTLASNLSAVFARRGLPVLHIGCDPKADSRRYLVPSRMPSILELLEEKESLNREDILHCGAFGVCCVESGGPEAGAGCAGMGIRTAVEELQRLGIFDEDWDVIVYDVLGDVVCGGFSVPMRQRFADRVYVVTSADFMALYAANNILKGVLRYSPADRSLCGGLILNHARNEADLDTARRFAARTSTELTGVFLESPALRLLDFQKALLSVSRPKDENARRMEALADRILSGCGRPSHRPTPMSREALDAFGAEIYERWQNHELFD